jgi:hypothetical protein
MMSSVRLQFGFLLLVAICLCISPVAEAQRRVRSPKKKPVAQVQQPAPTPVAPEPLRPEQLPAAAPRLTFQNGVLTIVAHNSTLGDILRDVKSKTGAAVDVPGNASERVVGQFGPGSPRDVLASLLNGSHFNYVMVGTAADPNSVAQVILTPRTGPETPPAPSDQSAVAGQQNGMVMVQPPVNGQPFPPRSFPQPQVQGQVDAADEPAPDSVEETQDESAQDQDTGENGDQGAPEQVNQGANGQNPNQPTVKTPEQLLQELQRQQQIMQQQQQQQGQNPQQQQSPPQVVYPIPQLQQPPQQEK